ncbi:MAG: hypothetical protein ACFFCW_11145 [Candidatus Hodarchaeota archaeon]
MEEDLKLAKKFFLPLQFSKGEHFYPCDLFFAGNYISKNWFRYRRMKTRPPLTYYYHINRYDDCTVIQYWFYFAYNIYPFATGPGKIAISNLIGDSEEETRKNLINQAKDPSLANRLIHQTDEVAEIPIRDIFLNLKRLLTVMDNHDHDFEKILVFLDPEGKKPTDVLLNHHLERFHYGKKEISEIKYPFLVYVERNSHGFCHTPCPPFVYCGDGLRAYGKHFLPISMEELKTKVEEVESHGIPVLDKNDNSLLCHDKTSLKIIVPWAREEFLDPKQDKKYVAVVDILERLGIDYDNPFVSLFNRAFIGLASQLMPLCDDVPGFVSFFDRFFTMLKDAFLFWKR